MENLATTEEVAAYLKVSPQTLANWAYQGKGPEYVKIEGQRRYEWATLRAWVEARKVSPSLPSESEVRRNMEELRAKGLVDYDPATDRYRINDLGHRVLTAGKQAEK